MGNGFKGFLAEQTASNIAGVEEVGIPTVFKIPKKMFYFFILFK